MGKVITATDDVKEQISSSGPNGPVLLEQTLYGFLKECLDIKGPIDSLDSIDTAIGLARKIKTAIAEKSSTLVLEDAEFKMLDDSSKKYLSHLIPIAAREFRKFYSALQKQTDSNPLGYQDIELSTKK